MQTLKMLHKNEVESILFFNMLLWFENLIVRMNTLWGLSVPSFFMMPDGRPYTQCSALSIMSCTLIPKLVVGTVCVAQMKLTGHRSDCCFNWSPEPRPSLSALHSKPRFSFQLLFLLPSSRGVLILLPSAVSIGTNVYQQAS